MTTTDPVPSAIGAWAVFHENHGRRTRATWAGYAEFDGAKLACPHEHKTPQAALVCATRLHPAEAES
jgi:hypothetical protein